VRTPFGILLLLAAGFVATQNTSSKLAGALAVVGAIMVLA
jgi:hypothetical protein